MTASSGTPEKSGEVKTPTFIFRPASFFERLNFATLFPSEQPVEVELGSGDGSFLAKYAQLQPQRNFIGVERLLGRLRKLDKKAHRAGLTNVRLLRIEASYFLEYMLPAESISGLHIYFPDPWPKRRHHKNRLINERFTQLTRQVLQSRGIVYLRTDEESYFTQMVTVFDANPDFEKIEAPADLTAVVTDFEREFNARGVPTRRATYQRKT